VRTSRLLILAGALVLGGSLVAASTVAQEKRGGPPGMEAMGGELVAALQKSPGCLGVELGGFKTGKLAIFAWFKDKESLLTWYRSDVHQGVMASLHAGMAAAKSAAGGAAETKEAPSAPPAQHQALEFVPDDVGTILCIATITPSAQPQVPGFPAPIGQISIELYKPLPGGASFGGTFAPLAVPLEHHRGSRVPPPAPAGPEKSGAKAGEKQGEKQGEKSGI
jgi:hypothetical protein